jgi:hypothetical protein
MSTTTKANSKIKYMLVKIYDPDRKLKNGTYAELEDEEEVWCLEAISTIKSIIESRNNMPNAKHEREKRRLDIFAQYTEDKFPSWDEEVKDEDGEKVRMNTGNWVMCGHRECKIQGMPGRVTSKGMYLMLDESCVDVCD